MFFCFTRPRYQVSVYRTTGPLVIISICPVYINVYARFDEIPPLTLKDIKETKR